MSRPRPDLWRAHGERQVYLTSSFSQALGLGPALTACATIPDLHYFSGRGAKDTIPLYRTADASQANITPDLLKILNTEYKRKVTPEDFLAYVYGVLAQPAFTTRFKNELGTRELRVPITKDAALFEKVRKAGARLLWLHTYGERFVPTQQTRGRVLPGAAKCVEAIPGYPENFAYNDATLTLRVGAGKFEPVRARGVRVRSLRPQGRAVLAQVPHEERGWQEILTSRRHPPRTLDQPVHHGTTRIALGSGGNGKVLSRTGEAAQSHRRQRLLPSRRNAVRPRRNAQAAA